MFKSLLSGFAGVASAAIIITAALHCTQPVGASDHDDGETNIKARNLNLTDLYVFREDWQTGAQADAGNMIFIMNTNPRSLPRQQYYFNTNAVYTFWVSRQADQEITPNGRPDLAFDFNFGTPDQSSSQPIFLNLRRFANGQEIGRETLSVGQTTPAFPLLGNPNPAPINNPVATSAGSLTVFAGLREDPFFFDVDSFFRTRAALANAASPSNLAPRGAGLIPNNPATAVDFAKGYNVNAIVMRVPIALLSNGTNQRVFDCWETISVPDNLAAVQ